MFPAQALAEALTERGWRVVLATDERGAVYADKFPAEKRIALSAATYRNGDPIGMARAGIQIARGVMQAGAAFKVIDPAIVVGFGGYPSLPALLAALSAKRPAMIHEQNAVLGRANRLLATRVDALALSFAETEKVPAGAQRRVVGNPVRPALAELSGQGYVAPAPDGVIRLLVLGGSLGARIFADVVPPAVARLDSQLRQRLVVTQQCRAEDLDRVRAAYDEAGVAAELSRFFPDVATRLAMAHLVIARAGASTVAELACAGRPSVLVPLPGAIDNHQAGNARALADFGGAWLMPQPEFTPEALSVRLAGLFGVPAPLASAAEAAARLGQPQAARALADLVVWLTRAPQLAAERKQALGLTETP